MATQHPDNASPAYFNNKKFINTLDELEECYLAYKDIGADEYMWDWEGKFVDEAVVDRLFRQYHAFFKKRKLGRDIFLTFRIPNIWEESGYRLARSFMAMITAQDQAHELALHSPPVFEVILPMTKRADQMLHIQEAFHKVARLKCEIFRNSGTCFDMINVIPIFEGTDDLVNSSKLLEEYIAEFAKKFKRKPAYLRPFIARSDPALNSGLVPAVISAKAAISGFYELAQKHGIEISPIIGTGSLPFRGGVNPSNIKEVINEYGGIRTLTIQSAFRYDYPMKDVKKAVAYIKKTLPRLAPRMLDQEELKKIKTLNAQFEEFYTKTVEKIAPYINKISRHIPSRRERMLHIGLLGYSRLVGKKSLPRAITYTGALYSIGIPPEFIGTGRGLQAAEKTGLLPFLSNIYINLKRDLEHAGKYLNRENLGVLAKKHKAFRDIARDIELIEQILKIKIGPHKVQHLLHRNLTSSIFLRLNVGTDVTYQIEEAARIRKSLG